MPDQKRKLDEIRQVLVTIVILRISLKKQCHTILTPRIKRVLHHISKIFIGIEMVITITYILLARLPNSILYLQIDVHPIYR